MGAKPAERRPRETPFRIKRVRIHNRVYAPRMPVWYTLIDERRSAISNSLRIGAAVTSVRRAAKVLGLSLRRERGERLPDEIILQVLSDGASLSSVQIWRRVAMVWGTAHQRTVIRRLNVLVANGQLIQSGDKVHTRYRSRRST